MFDSVLGRGTTASSKFGAGTVVSVLLHVGVLAGVLWMGSQPPPEEKVEPEVTFFAAPAPPPPPPPPPPPAGGATKPKVEKKVEKKIKKPETIVQPKEIPVEKPPETEPQPEPESDEPEPEGVAGGVEGGVEGGVVGGVVGGVEGGVIGGVLGGTVGGQLGGDVLNFGAGMTRPVRQEGRDPVYTHAARAARVEGTMLVRCVITTEGNVQDCNVLKPLPHMTAAVMEALSTWRMSPVMFQGRPVAVRIVIPIKLKLQ